MKNASLARRLGAMLYDSLLVLAILFVATVPFVIAAGEQPVTGNLIYQLCVLGLIFAFYVGFWVGPGRTLGMQSWRLQLVTAANDEPGFAKASLRFAIAALLLLPAVIGLFAQIVANARGEETGLVAFAWLLPAGLFFFWQLIDRQGLSLQDRLSGTRLLHYPKTVGEKKTID